MSDTAMRSDASKRAMSRGGTVPARRCDGARRGDEHCDARCLAPLLDEVVILCEFTPHNISGSAASTT